ncbi:MAG: hypothetical protein N3D82_04280 [Ignisphaera sp.]|nr:hypothetical protein [Ignisphaera sp.]MCX8168226.1 hypothetical protein [Ignisphaera sp.]
MNIKEITIVHIIEQLQPYLNVIIALSMMIVAYLIAKKLLYKLRLKGIITHGTESTLRIIILVFIVTIALPVMLSSIFQRYNCMAFNSHFYSDGCDCGSVTV